VELEAAAADERSALHLQARAKLRRAGDLLPCDPHAFAKVLDRWLPAEPDLAGHDVDAQVVEPHAALPIVAQGTVGVGRPLERDRADGDRAYLLGVQLVDLHAPRLRFGAAVLTRDEREQRRRGAVLPGWRRRRGRSGALVVLGCDANAGHVEPPGMQPPLEQRDRSDAHVDALCRQGPARARAPLCDAHAAQSYAHRGYRVARGVLDLHRVEREQAATEGREQDDVGDEEVGAGAR
jgi:hypothetical protein